MTLYRNKYRIESTRWQSWDYANAGAYFITICTKNRLHYFGEIDTVQPQSIAAPPNSNAASPPPPVQPHCDVAPQYNPMILSEIGKIAAAEWIKTPDIRPDMNLILGEFVVMPNHFHAIIIIGDNQYNTVQPHCNVAQNPDSHESPPVQQQCIVAPAFGIVPQQPESNQPLVKMHGNASSQSNASLQNQFGPQRKNLAAIIRGFKSAVTVQARKIQPDFGWQSLYHDHVTRNEQEHNRIAHYILNNPYNWTEDNYQK